MDSSEPSSPNLNNPSNALSNSSGNVSEGFFDPSTFAMSLNFDEPDNENNMLRDADGQIKGASFAKIICKMVDPQNFEVKFVMDMLFTYRSFATSFEVLGALIQRWESASGPDKGIILIRVCNVLNLWLDKVFYDFEKDCPALSDQLQTFLDRCMKDPDAKTSRVATSVHTVLMKRLRGEGRIRGDENTTVVGKAPLPHLPKDAGTPLMKIHPEEIARQITLLEWAIWREIRPWECLGLAWTKKDKEARAPHICEAQNRFNRISGWVATTIISTEKLADRAKVLSKFIDIAVYLNKLNNFAGTLQVVSGISNAAVYRLTQTWNAISSTQRRQYEDLAKLNEKNNRVLRERIRLANPPCIPFFGMYQTDLTFVEEGNADLIGPNGNLHNCTKRRLTADIIQAIHQYQLQPYVLAPLDFVQDMILSAPILDEAMLYDMSEWIEPRKGAEPKKVKPAGFDLQANMASSTNKIELELVMGYPFYVADAPSNIQLNPNTHSIKYATLAKMIEHLTHQSSPDTASLEGFLASYRSFMSPTELFNLVEKRWNMPPPKDKSPSGLERYQKELQNPVYVRVTNLLKSWMEKHFYDFEEDPALKKRLQLFLGQVCMPYCATLNKALQRAEAGTPIAAADQSAPPPNSPMPGFDPATASLLDVDAIELARQLTIAQHAQFETVLPRECLDKASKSAQKVTKAPNVLRVLNYNESLTLWFEDQLKLADEQNIAVAVLTRLLEVLEHAATVLHNWQLVSVVIDAIQAFLPSNDPGPKFATLSPQLWTAYDKYRLILADQAKCRDSLITTPPAILPLRFILSEVESIEDRLGKDAIGTLINLEKRRAAGDVCVQMMQLQRLHYNLTPVPIIQQMIELRYRQYVVAIGSEVSSAPRNKIAQNASIQDVSPEFKQAMMDFIGTDEDFRAELANCINDIFRNDMLEQARNIALGAQEEFVIRPGGISSIEIGSPMTSSFSLTNGRPMSVNADQLFSPQSSFGSLKITPRTNLHQHLRAPSSLVLGQTKMNSPRVGSPPLSQSTDSVSNKALSPSTSNSQLITVPVDANGIMTLRPIPNNDDALFAQASTLLQKDFNGIIESVSFFDEAGVVYGKPAHINLDVIIKNQHHYLCSFSPVIKEYDVQLLVQVGKLYKNHVPSCALACVVVTRSIAPEVHATADRYKMKVYVVPEP